MNITEIISKVLTNSNSAFFYTPSFYEKSYSYLFQNPVEKISVNNPDEVEKALINIDRNINKGLWGYGLINFETGYLFENKLKKYAEKNEDYLNFYFFKEKDVKKIKSSKINFEDFYNDYSINSFSLNVSKDDYINNVKKIKEFISEGDTYQVNYTLKGNFKFNGNIPELFKILSFNQSAKYTALINSGSEVIISLSPELFFQTKGNKIITKPMKGTIRRGYNSFSDSLNNYNLKENEKEKAENLMIVDLLRNDLGKLSKYEKVKTEQLFEIEKYETLYQMISKVKAEMKKGITFSDILKNIFPSGSITGAPKIRTMEIIKELENENRGLYTGAIGIIKPKESIFNIAIRTAVINKENNLGEIGLGSGIVWDSDPEKEYEEILLKSNFFLKPQNYFELFETMRVENGNINYLDDHIDRLKNAAEYFLFSFNEKKIRKYVEISLNKLDNKKLYRYKLLLNKWGKINTEINKQTDIEENKIKVILSDKQIDSQYPFQYFKTTNRKLYNDELNYYKSKGFFDVLFLNEKNQIAEGAITNIFIKKGETLFTPPIDAGILNGICRKNILKSSANIREQYLYEDDLFSADKIILTNAFRGEVKVNYLYLNENEFKEF